MPVTKYCTRCGLEAVLPESEEEPPPCALCDGTDFVTAGDLAWRVRLSQNDKRFLKSLRIAAD